MYISYFVVSAPKFTGFFFAERGNAGRMAVNTLVFFDFPKSRRILHVFGQQSLRGGAPPDFLPGL